MAADFFIDEVVWTFGGLVGKRIQLEPEGAQTVGDIKTISHAKPDKISRQVQLVFDDATTALLNQDTKYTFPDLVDPGMTAPTRKKQKGAYKALIFKV